MTEQSQTKERACFICSRDTMDGAYPALILGINAARLGLETKVFYTFMGVNLVRKGGIEKAKFIPPGVMGAVPGMSSMATAMMKKKIEKAQIPTLPDLMEMAQIGRGRTHRLQDDLRHDGNEGRGHDRRRADLGRRRNL